LPLATASACTAHSGSLWRRSARARALAGFFSVAPYHRAPPPRRHRRLLRTPSASRTRTVVSPECTVATAAAGVYCTVSFTSVCCIIVRHRRGALRVSDDAPPGNRDYYLFNFKILYFYPVQVARPVVLSVVVKNKKNIINDNYIIRLIRENKYLYFVTCCISLVHRRVLVPSHEHHQRPRDYRTHCYTVISIICTRNNYNYNNMSIVHLTLISARWRVWKFKICFVRIANHDMNFYFIF